ncbi:iron ABC transporter permease [Kistimonas scapharcae]|uniref:Iron ABC transporter permease n=1 Tax=Kistimonas scapharcae TaxID=1036133 RepID=A0ABP8VA32_9GAMM
MTAITLEHTANTLQRNAIIVPGLLVAVCLLAIASMVLGYTDITGKHAIEALFSYDGSREHIVVIDMRLPRVIIALMVGGSLAVAGTLMQGLTRNPLASPAIFGINSGASLAIVIATAVFGITSLEGYTLFAMVGAALAALVVYWLGMSGGSQSPLNLTLAGVAISAFLSSLTSGLLVFNESALEEVLFWLSGSVEGRRLDLVMPLVPLQLAGWLGALALSSAMNAQALGDDVAKGLGQRTLRVKLLASLVIVLLAGTSVAMAGPIAFVGLVAPHLARGLAGTNFRWTTPVSILLGGGLLLVADILTRFIVWPREAPVGVTMALIGAPFFILYARRNLNT